MKKLIIYDASCPMCRLYTKGMIAADSSGTLTRLGSHQLTDKALLGRLDRQRAKHEIPMIDLDGDETLYGIDTWGYAFGRRSQWLTKLLSLRWFRALMQRIYAFISYNRRIIITSAPDRWQLMDLQPEFRLNYRLTFIFMIGSLAGILHYAVARSFSWPVLGLLGGQVGLVGLYLWLTKHPDFLETLLDYYGHLAISLLLGGVITAIGLAFNWPQSVQIGTALGISQHFIRTYRLGLNPWLSASFTMLYLLILRL